jgi:hypothetical protein
MSGSQSDGSLILVEDDPFRRAGEHDSLGDAITAHDGDFETPDFN